MDTLIFTFFVFYLKFRFNWTPCILSGNSEYVFFCMFLIYTGVYVHRDLPGWRQISPS